MLWAYQALGSLMGITYSSMKELRKHIAKHRIFSFDFESTSESGTKEDNTNPWIARPILLSIACYDKVGVFSITEELKEFFVELCENPEYTAMAHNARFDCILAHASGMLDFPTQFKAKLLDTLALFWQVNEEEPHGQKYLESKYLRTRDNRSYEEATKTHPIYVEMRRLTALAQRHKDNLARWDQPIARRWRPYPTFQDESQPWIRIRRALINSKEWTQADVQLRENAEWLKEQRELLLGDGELAKYKKYVARGAQEVDRRIRPLARQAKALFKEYAAKDSLRLFGLLKVAKRILTKENQWHWVHVEQAAVREGIEMEIAGMAVDKEGILERKKVLDPLVDAFLGEIHTLAKQEFNPDSPSQLCRVLFSTMRLTPPPYRQVYLAAEQRSVWMPKLNKRGEDWVKVNGVFSCETTPDAVRLSGLSTDKNTLEMLDHPIGQKILDYRTVAKLRSTYINKVPALLDLSPDGRLHARFNSVGTKTGRFSSNSPNLQNIPARGKSAQYDERIRNLGVELREAFQPWDPDEEYPGGYVLIVCDQSQIELRMMAYVTGDHSLTEIYRRHVIVDGVTFYVGDVHQKTATSLNIKRKDAKGVNFGFNYGMMPPKFARQNMLLKPGTMEYDIERAAAWQSGFFAEYAGIPMKMQELEDAWNHGQSEFPMISGRRRRFDPTDRVQKGKILNAVIQGSSADLLKVNMMIIRKFVIPRFPGLRLIFQVHDELGFVCPREYAEEAAIVIKYVMEYPYFQLSVPILAGAKLCESWADKDRDEVPEVGVFYAQVDGEHDRLFDAETWHEYCELDAAKRITLKSATAMLTNEHLEFCRSIVPDRGPLFQSTGDSRRILGREAEVAARRAAAAELTQVAVAVDHQEGSKPLDIDPLFDL